MSKSRETSSAGGVPTDTAVSVARQSEPSVHLPAILPAGYLTNIDVTSFAGRALVANAASPGELDFTDTRKDDLGRRYVELLAVQYVAYPTQVQSREGGELVDVVRTVLIDQRGQTYRTTAPHAVGRIQAWQALFTREEWSRGIPVRITERPGSRGSPYHDLKIMPGLLGENGEAMP